MTWIGGSKQAWDARQNLLDAASLIESACAWAEKDEVVYDRLGEFEWEGITIPLDEAAGELRRVAEFIVDHKRVQPWEETEHLCGYSVFMGESDHCYHEGCWEESREIGIALAMQRAVKEKLHNFQVDDKPSDYDAGYEAAMQDLERWVGMWQRYKEDPLGEGNFEEHERVATVVKSGGGFEDFIIRELYFIKEAS